jgi:hypothetical protein
MSSDREKQRVREFAQETGIGFGRLMQLGQQLWAEHLANCGYPTGGEFTVGPCAAELVDCQCVGRTARTEAELDNGGGFRGCDWCCCTRRVTKHVREMQEKSEQIVRRAEEMAESAHGQMRSASARIGVDRVAAERSQIIAGREYMWAAYLYMDAGRPAAGQRCLHLADAVRCGEWRDPEAAA